MRLGGRALWLVLHDIDDGGQSRTVVSQCDPCPQQSPCRWVVNILLGRIGPTMSGANGLL